MSTREELRKKIDEVDDELIEVLGRRFTLTREMRELKVREGLPGRDEKREQAIIERMLAKSDPAERDTVFGVYERIFNGSRGVIETIARGVAVKDGKVLLCRAKGGKSTYLPGGHIEFGETGAVALVREIKEELGADSRAGRLLGVVENSFLQHGKPHSEINLVYELELLNLSELSALEDWIEFEWCPVESVASANLLPSAMIEHIPGARIE